MTDTHNTSRSDRVLMGIGRHWLALFNGAVALYVLLPIVAPLMLHLGIEKPAHLIYRAYGLTCHQMAFRSFFVGGEQPVYPRDRAKTLIDWETFEMAVQHDDHFHTLSFDGLSPQLMTAARTYNGSAEMGYKTAICQRDMGIWGFLLVGGLLYGLLRTRMRVRPMPLIVFIILGMGPIGLDGFSQLFGYFGLDVGLFSAFPVRESPPWLRTLTGAWFGFSIAWLMLPRLDVDHNR